MKAANAVAEGVWREHAVQDTPSRSAATTHKHYNFIFPRGCRRRAAGGST